MQRMFTPERRGERVFRHPRGSGLALLLALLFIPIASRESLARTPAAKDPAPLHSCRTVSACGVTPCAFSNPATWTACGGTFPQPTDSWTVQAGHEVVLDANVTTLYGTVNGTLHTLPDAGVTLTVTGTIRGELTVGATGTFVMRQGDSLVCDSTIGSCDYIVVSGGLLDLQGSVDETTIAGPILDAAADVATCGTVAGRKWTITLPAVAPSATVGGRLRFLSGKARDREFEVVDVSGAAITVCTLLDDGKSVSAYGGQRLTPHAPIGSLGTRHHVPTVSDDASPFYAAPAPGDRVALIHDVTLRQIGGTRGYRIGQLTHGGLAVAPLLRAVHLSGLGIPGGPSIVLTAAGPGQSFGAYEYINLHDYNGTDQFLVAGWKRSVFRYITGHDAGPDAGDSSGILVPLPARLVDGANGDYPADGVDILDSTFYRTRGNAINLNVSGTVLSSTGNIVRGNLAFDGCTTTSGECTGIEVNACRSCEVSWNAVYDICRVDGTDGDLMHLGDAGVGLSQGSVAHHNWLVNGCGEGLVANYGQPGSGRDVTFTANYISHVRLHGGNGGRWYGDVVRNWGLDNSNARNGINNPQAVASTWLLGNDPSIANGPGCGAGCSRNGLYFDTFGVNAPGDTVVVRDVWVGGLDSALSDGVRVDTSTDFDVKIARFSCDNFGATSDACLYFKTTNPVHVTAGDLTAEGMAGGLAARCSAVATDTVGNLLYARTLGTADDVKVSETGCDGTGVWTGLPTVGHVDPAGGDLNFVPNAPGLALASDGGPIGFRAFRSLEGAINAFWGGLLPFDLLQPADVTGASIEDTDGDGVIDVYDSCGGVWNPSQYGTTCPASVCVSDDSIGWATPCDDGNPCTVSDVCDPYHHCSGTPLYAGSACDDHDACTQGDRCVAGTGQEVACAGQASDCSDGDPCTLDRCDAATGQCQHAPVVCEDGNACTLESCDPATGACRIDVRVFCDDGNPCTEDVCSNGACAPIPEPDGLPCGGPCSGGTSTCQAGVCTGATPPDCDDGNACTADRCDPAVGCVHEGPTAPSKEVCNGRDDDCDGLVDERSLVPTCQVTPSSVNRSSPPADFSVSCWWTPNCLGRTSPLEPIGPAWLSAADLASDSSDDAALPDPFDHCAEAIVENDARRKVTSATVTFVFDPTGNGVCGTAGGGMAGLLGALGNVPGGSQARVCIRWRREGIGDEERCGALFLDGSAAPILKTDPVRTGVAPAP